MTLLEIFAIIIIHWVADFVFQDEKWALGKSKNIKDLLSHTITYTICWIPFLYIIKSYYNIQGFNYLGFFLPITLIAHTITDYFTSRIVSKKFAKNHLGSSIPNFGAFSIIGFDQVLHYVQLFTTYYYLKTLI
jgi:hypothetical protein